MLIFESLNLALLVFFKPFKLDEELKAIGPYLAANVPIWQVRSGLSPAERRIVIKALVAIALGVMVWPLFSMTFLYDRPEFWLDIMIVSVSSGLLGVVGLFLVGISFGVTMGTSVSLVGILATIVDYGSALAVLRFENPSQLVIFGLFSGLVLGLILGIAAMASFMMRTANKWFWGTCGLVSGVSLGIFVAQVTGWNVESLAMGFILALLFMLSFFSVFWLGHRRVPFYVFELFGQLVVTGLSTLVSRLGRSEQLVCQLYRFSPVTRDELIWFPLWTLDRQLIQLALAGDRPFALEAIGKIARSFRQGWAAESALAAILTHDLQDCRSIPEMAGAAERLEWFPRAVDSPSLRLRRVVTLINEMSQNAEAANRNLGSPGWRINLRKAQGNLDALQETLARMDRRIASALESIVQCWKKTIEQALQSVSRDEGPALIENLYIAGNPIPPDKEHIFVGREDLFLQIQEDLDATQKPTLVLHGQRRTGKTSLLLQLPNRLSAEYVPVYIDLQSTLPADGLNRFLYTLARGATRQADEKRRIALPPVELADFDQRGTHAFYEWLELAHKQLDGRLLLFALDEFEKIEEAIAQGRLEKAVLDVLRHLIQHHSHWLVLLFAGVRTLDELGRNWHSYFISVRPIHVSYLDAQAARQLILLPARTCPIRYDEEAVNVITEATHGQPFLIQAVCFDLVQHLNSRQRRLAGPFGWVTSDDAKYAINSAIRSANPYFQDLWASSSDLERLVMVGVANAPSELAQIRDLGKELELSARDVHKAVEQLRRRQVVERSKGTCLFRAPMMRQWVREEKSLDAVRVASQPAPEAVRKRE